MDEVSLRRAASAYRLSQAIYAAAHLRIADHLADGPAGHVELASSLGADATNLRRLMRALSSEGIFAETDDGRFLLNDAGRLLRSGAGAREMIVGWSALEPSYMAFAKLMQAVKEGGEPFRLAHHTDFHEYLLTHPEARVAYDEAMNSTVTDFQDAAKQYDFGRFDTVVDVGGGGGAFMVAVARRYPHVHAISVDLPSVIEGSRLPIPDDLSERVELRELDFFRDRLPTADCFVLSTVLRLFDDRPAQQLLSAIRAAMHMSSRVVVMDFVQPEGPLPAPYGLADLQTFAVYGGKDRTLEEFRRLFQSVGLTVDQVVRAGTYGIFDATWLAISTPAQIS
jgi:hypothetical protein